DQVDCDVPALAQGGPGMGEDDHPPGPDRVVAAAEESFQLGGGLVELDTGGTAPPVGNPPLLNQVAVVVVLAEPPLAAVSFHGCFAVLDLDREHAPRSEENVVDLPATVAVTVQQRPLISQDRPKVGCHYVLARYPGGQNRFLGGDTVLHRSWPGGLALNRWPGTLLLGVPGHDGGLGPGKPAAISASAVPVPAQGGEASAV